MQNKKADQIEQQSAAECASLLAQARSQAKTETAEALAKARADSRQILQQARQKSDETLAQAVVDAESKFGSCVKLRWPKEEAIRIILSELI